MPKVQSIYELERLNYGRGINFVQKADSNIQTDTSGVFNAVFGGLAWANLNLEANPFAVFPKYVYDKSGYRLIDAEAELTTTNANTALGGTAEGGRIAETTKPGLAEVQIKPKLVQLPFGASTVQEWLSNHSKDDIWGSLASLRVYMATQFKLNMARMISADVEGQASRASGNYAGSIDWESYDRIVSNSAEESVKGGNTHSGWYDVYNKLDRDSTTKYDSVVKSATDGALNSGNDKLIKEHIIDFYRDIKIKGGKAPNVGLVDHSVYGEIQKIFESATRYQMDDNYVVSLDINGVSTYNGRNAGLHVTSVYGVPLIATNISTKFDSDEVGRMYMFDTSDADGFGYPPVRYSDCNTPDI